jgi:glutamyl-tRNA reductase
LQKKLLKELENSNGLNLIERIVSVRITHKKASIQELENITFKDREAIMKEIKTLDNIQECLLLQTCNRVEIYAVLSDHSYGSIKSELTEYWQQRIEIDTGKLSQLLESASGLEALLHLLRLSSGLDSMVVGEDQILGQIEDSYEIGKRCGTVGPILQSFFERAIKTGRMIRHKTKINKGSVSIGSVAVNLLEESIHDLTGKRIMIIGAGETGALVGKALAARKAAMIFVANKTYEKAVDLAKSLRGEAVHFDGLIRHLSLVDAVIVATSAPHYLITHNLLAEVMKERVSRKIIIIDVSHPRNVEETVTDIPNVELHNIDGLRNVAHMNLKTRAKESEKAESVIIEELMNMVLMLKRNRVEPVISGIYTKAEEIRCREVSKALKMIRKVSCNDSSKEPKCRRCEKIVEDLSLVLFERFLSNPITYLRKASMDDDLGSILTVKNLFNIKKLDNE